MRILLLILCLTLARAENEEIPRDLAFKDIELQKIIESLAKLQGKSVLFSKTIDAKPVSINLTQVTPAFALRLILENYGFIAVPKGDVLHIMTQAERGVSAVSPSAIITLKNVVAREMAEIIQRFIGTNGGTVQAHDSLNALLVNASEDNLLRIRKLVAELDQEQAQVYIEAKIIETSSAYSKSFGIQWGKAADPAGINKSRDFSITAPGGEGTMMGIVRAAGLEAQINAGIANGDVRVISSPKVTTLNGLAAHIQDATTFSIRTLSATGSGGAAAANGAIQTVKAGVDLTVTPYIVSQEQVRLNINLSKSDPDFARQVDGIPGISDKAARTSLIVRDGQTASIGGLITHSDSNSSRGAPILSKIPLIGLLFGGDEHKEDDKELLIFITPSIFRGDRTGFGPPIKINPDAFADMEPLKVNNVSAAPPAKEPEKVAEKVPEPAKKVEVEVPPPATPPRP